MAVISWSNTTPGDDMTASSVDDQLRSDFTAIRTGLEEFMYWTDGSSNSAGEWKLGTARLRSEDDDTLPQGLGPQGSLGGRIHDGPATGDVGGEHYGMWHIGSANTMLVGHAQLSEHIDDPSSAPFATHWIVEEGKTEVTLDRSGTPLVRSSITFSLEYTVVPNVIATLYGGTSIAGQEDFTFGIDSIATSGFSSEVSLASVFGTSTSIVTVCWSSLGTVVW